MKETYRIPRTPEIACNGNRVGSEGSEELLRILGFCNSDKPASQEAREGEEGLDAAEPPLPSVDDSDPIYLTDNFFLKTWKEQDLRLRAI